MPHLLATPLGHFRLIGRLVRREIEARYRGSLLGLAWAVMLPLALMGIYAFVFGTVFQARWQLPESTGTPYSYAMLMFSGLLAYTLFADCAARAPGLILENVSYVKRVVFPLEILPWVALGTAAVNAAIGFAVFFVLFVILYGLPPATAILLPLAMAPIALIGLAALYLLSSLGVFLRDLRHVLPLIVTAMMFLSPVLFPLDAVPDDFRTLLLLNPLTPGIQHVREVLFFGTVPDLEGWLLYAGAALAAVWLAEAWFARTKKAFADVV